MNKNWKNIGLIALAAGVLYYPALKMYRIASEKKNGHNGLDPQKDKNGNSGNNNNDNNRIGRA